MFSVQLAASEPFTEATIDKYGNGEWVYDLKMDGLRAVLVCNEGSVRIWNRSGNEITHQWPEIVAFAKQTFPGLQVILDGELVVDDSDGRPNFKLTATRGKQQKPAAIEAKSKLYPGRFHAFDQLYIGGVDIRGNKYRDRKDLLAITMELVDDPDPRIVHRSPWTDGHEAMRYVLENKAEGLIIKRLGSTYQAGRRSDWVKVKPTFTATCVVTGWEGGDGARSSTFGALKLALIQDNKQVSVGKVGTGFKDDDLLEMQTLLAGRLPYTSLDDAIIIEVEYQEFTEDGALRFPVYRGLRIDQTIHDCTLDQVLPKAQEATT